MKSQQFSVQKSLKKLYAFFFEFWPLEKWFSGTPEVSSSFERASTLGHTPTALGHRIYLFYFTRLLYCPCRSAVCSEAPHSQFDEGTRSHFKWTNAIAEHHFADN